VNVGNPGGFNPLASSFFLSRRNRLPEKTHGAGRVSRYLKVKKGGERKKDQSKMRLVGGRRDRRGIAGLLGETTSVLAESGGEKCWVLLEETGAYLGPTGGEFGKKKSPGFGHDFRGRGGDGKSLVSSSRSGRSSKLGLKRLSSVSMILDRLNFLGTCDEGKSGRDGWLRKIGRGCARAVWEVHWTRVSMLEG